MLAACVGHLAYSSHIPADGEAAFELAAGRKFEGIISKRADAQYHPGRGDDWRKTKHLASDEFAVVGTTPAKGARQGFGSLLLARPDPDGGWVYAGRVGSDFSDQQLRKIGRYIGAQGSPKPTVRIPGSKEAELKAAGKAHRLHCRSAGRSCRA